ncbi:membrane protein [Terrihabitans soli]|uniref:Membrane protein n=1 Tax=Terrihabitans soli TaxID=708113 RepID=A0A6S6QRW6_9HYPH|nr:DUF2177 family protein [Terrihabitans soli]BCJ90465.1 membrane protein [Terrihabitans soli]
MQHLIAYLSVLAIFSVIDTLWLGTMASKVYRPLLGDIVIQDFRVAPAIAFYLFYAIGLVIFAVAPALKNGQWTTALLWGALFGLFAYGTYDLTNYATLRNWGFKVTAIDMAWGTFVSGTASLLAYAVSSWLLKLFGSAS